MRNFDDPAVFDANADIGAFERQSLTLVVDTNTDFVDGIYSAGQLSLREAIQLANANINLADEITFDPSVFNGGNNSLIRLQQGELVITDTLTIDGLSGTQVTITGDADDNDTTDAANITDLSIDLDQPEVLEDNTRVINFSSTAGDLTLSGLTITGGRSAISGGGIFTTSLGNLTIQRSTISGNSTDNDTALGGGISSPNADLTIIYSTVSDNAATGTQSSGGGIFSSSGDVTVLDTVVSKNSVVAANTSSASGGGIHSFSGNVTITNSTISDNFASGAVAGGAGIFIVNSESKIINSTVSGNSVFAPVNAIGGGIYLNSGSVSLSYSIVSENEVVIINNTNANTKAVGGGIGTEGGVIFLTNSTISGNNTTGPNSSRGGGLYNRSGAITLSSATVSDNSAFGVGGTGGGVFVGDPLEGGERTLTIANSIVAGNAAGGTAPDLKTDPGSLLLVAYSLIGDATSGLTPTQINAINASQGNLLNVDPLLGPLAFNGNSTKTHALLPGSPASNSATIGPINVAPSGIATQSSEFEFTPFPTSNANDIDFNTFTHTATTDSQASWEVDLGIEREIVSITLFNRDDPGTASRLRDITVEVLAEFGGVQYTSPLLNPENALGNMVASQGPSSLTVNLASLPIGSAFGNKVRVTRTADPDLSGIGGVVNPNASTANADRNVLSLVEVTVGIKAPIADQRGFNRDVNGGDMGAYEAQSVPSADFVDDDVINGSDFLAWQRGFGTPFGATRVDGNSDDDGDVDASDLAAWSLTYGQSEPNPLQELAASEPIEVSAAADNNLLDAAVAWQLLSLEQPENETSTVQETVFAELFAEASELDTTSAQTGVSSALGIVAAESAVDEDEGEQPWLTEELLEEVFG